MLCTHCDLLDIARCDISVKKKEVDVDEKALPILPAGLGHVSVTFSASRSGVRVAGETGRGSAIVFGQIKVERFVITDYLRNSDGFSAWHMVGHGVHLYLKLLARGEVGEGEGGGGAGDCNWGAPGSGACLAKGAVLDVVLRVQRGDGCLPAQAHSVVLVTIGIL